MRTRHRRVTSILCALLLCGMLTVLEAAPAQAGSSVKRSGGTMKRSAGTVRRSAGNRAGNSLGSRTRGHSPSMTSSRRSSSESDDDDHDRNARESDDDEKRDAARSGPEREEDSEEEAPDYGARTLGNACIYGVRGEVVFRPRGGWCRGDPATETAPAAVAPSSSPRRSPPATSSTVKRSPGERLPKVKAKVPSKQPPRDRCTYDGNGRLAHTPAGEFCPPRAVNREPKGLR